MSLLKSLSPHLQNTLRSKGDYQTWLWTFLRSLMLVVAMWHILFSLKFVVIDLCISKVDKCRSISLFFSAISIYIYNFSSYFWLENFSALFYNLPINSFKWLWHLCHYFIDYPSSVCFIWNSIHIFFSCQWIFFLLSSS